MALPCSAQSEGPVVQTNLLGIGICPPWHAQAVEVCSNSTQTVIDALSERLALPETHTRLLINEGASAGGLKKMVMELASNLDQAHRLIVYANLPTQVYKPIPQENGEWHVMELWADEEPTSVQEAIETGTWITAPAFAAMLHTVPAGEVILVLDTSNTEAINKQLLAAHVTDSNTRPEALITSAGKDQVANYSADRTIALFAKHLANALTSTNGSLLEVITVASSGTRQAAIPICVSLKESLPAEVTEKDCTQIPEIHDPANLLPAIPLPDLPEEEAKE